MKLNKKFIFQKMTGKENISAYIIKNGIIVFAGYISEKRLKIKKTIGKLNFKPDMPVRLSASVNQFIVSAHVSSVLYRESCEIMPLSGQ